MAEAEFQAILRQEEVWLHRLQTGRHASRALAQDRSRSRRHDVQEVPVRQARVPRRPEVRAPRRHQAA